MLKVQVVLQHGFAPPVFPCTERSAASELKADLANTTKALEEMEAQLHAETAAKGIKGLACKPCAVAA